jgi:hypothetical protein
VAENGTGPAIAQRVRTGPREADPQLLPIPHIVESSAGQQKVLLIHAETTDGGRTCRTIYHRQSSEQMSNDRPPELAVSG